MVKRTNTPALKYHFYPYGKEILIYFLRRLPTLPYLSYSHFFPPPSASHRGPSAAVFIPSPPPCFHLPIRTDQSEIRIQADPSSSCRSSTSITDLDIDALTHCASYLNLRDVSSLAMSCKYLYKVAYADSIWQSLYRQEWPEVVPLSNQASSTREAYLSRHTALYQFKYVDPLLNDVYIAGKPPHHLLFDKNNIIFSQGTSVHSLQNDNLIDGGMSCILRGNHNARVTCVRLFSSSEAYLHQSDSERDDSILITSSNDHCVRLWSKGGNRCFKGHSGPVLTLSDKLLGDDTGKIFASGGEDGTVRLWSIYSSGKRVQHALKATLHGHDKAVSRMSVAGHKPSLLVSIAKNGKGLGHHDSIIFYCSSSCVGMTSVPLGPVGMKCHESLLYVATRSSVTAVDLRTMHKAFTLDQHTKVHSFEILPTKSAFCTGETDRAMLWDIRSVSKPSVELDGHVGPIKHVFMDSFKIVTGGPDDPFVNVWEVDTGKRTNSFISSASDQPSGCSAIAVDGCRIVTSGGVDEETARVCIRDFKAATCYFSTNASEESPSCSKFWDSNSGGSDSEQDWQ